MNRREAIAGMIGAAGAAAMPVEKFVSPFAMPASEKAKLNDAIHGIHD